MAYNGDNCRASFSEEQIEKINLIANTIRNDLSGISYIENLEISTSSNIKSDITLMRNCTINHNGALEVKICNKAILNNSIKIKKGGTLSIKH